MSSCIVARLSLYKIVTHLIVSSVMWTVIVRMKQWTSSFLPCTARAVYCHSYPAASRAAHY